MKLFGVPRSLMDKFIIFMIYYNVARAIIWLALTYMRKRIDYLYKEKDSSRFYPSAHIHLFALHNLIKLRYFYLIPYSSRSFDLPLARIR